MRRTKLRWCVATAAVLCVAALVAVGPAFGKAPPNFRASGVATSIDGSGNCCYYSAYATGTATFSFGGAATFTSEASSGCTPSYAPPPYICERYFQMTLRAANGDELYLTGQNSTLTGTPLPLPPWRAVPERSTGRFAHFTGFGTYEIVGGNLFTASGTLLPIRAP